MREESRWSLFLDESGDFIAPRWPVACVAGFMVRDDDPRALRANLATMVERAAPLAPYPLHAAHANLGAYWLAGWVAAGASRREAFSRRHPACAAQMPRWCDEARAVLSDAEGAAAFFASLDAGAFPDYPALKAATDALWAHSPTIARALAEVVRATRGDVAAMIDAIAEAYSESRCHLVAAAWFVDDDPDGALEGSRYLHALSALFERVALTLRERGDRLHRVDAHVSRLGIDHPVLASSGRLLPLRAADVGAAAQRAGCGPAAVPLPVRIVPDVPAAFDASVHPGFVIADHLANALWNAVREGDRGAWGSRSWARLADGLSRRLRGARGARPHDAVLRFEAPVRAVVETGERGPMIAVTGGAAAHVRRAWATPSAEPARCEGASALWAREQADRWAQLAWRAQR